MSILLFKLNGVPDDEAADVRNLLSEHGIDYYETPEGRWGISLGGIWLMDDEQLPRARALIDAYQQKRSAQARQAYEQRRREGRGETALGRLAHQPLRSLAYLSAILLILYLSVRPFWPR